MKFSPVFVGLLLVTSIGVAYGLSCPQPAISRSIGLLDDMVFSPRSSLSRTRSVCSRAGDEAISSKELLDILPVNVSMSGSAQVPQLKCRADLGGISGQNVVDYLKLFSVDCIGEELGSGELEEKNINVTSSDGELEKGISWTGCLGARLNKEKRNDLPKSTIVSFNLTSIYCNINTTAGLNLWFTLPDRKISFKDRTPECRSRVILAPVVPKGNVGGEANTNTNEGSDLLPPSNRVEFKLIYSDPDGNQSSPLKIELDPDAFLLAHGKLKYCNKVFSTPFEHCDEEDFKELDKENLPADLGSGKYAYYPDPGTPPMVTDVFHFSASNRLNCSGNITLVVSPVVNVTIVGSDGTDSSSSVAPLKKLDATKGPQVLGPIQGRSTVTVPLTFRAKAVKGLEAEEGEENSCAHFCRLTAQEALDFISGSGAASYEDCGGIDNPNRIVAGQNISIQSKSDKFFDQTYVLVVPNASLPVGSSCNTELNISAEVRSLQFKEEDEGKKKIALTSSIQSPVVKFPIQVTGPTASRGKEDSKSPDGSIICNNAAPLLLPPVTSSDTGESPKIEVKMKELFTLTHDGQLQPDVDVKFLSASAEGTNVAFFSYSGLPKQIKTPLTSPDDVQRDVPISGTRVFITSSSASSTAEPSSSITGQFSIEFYPQKFTCVYDFSFSPKPSSSSETSSTGSTTTIETTTPAPPAGDETTPIPSSTEQTDSPTASSTSTTGAPPVESTTTESPAASPTSSSSSASSTLGDSTTTTTTPTTAKTESETEAPTRAPSTAAPPKKTKPPRTTKKPVVKTTTPAPSASAPTPNPTTPAPTKAPPPEETPEPTTTKKEGNDGDETPEPTTASNAGSGNTNKLPIGGSSSTSSSTSSSNKLFFFMILIIAGAAAYMYREQINTQLIPYLRAQLNGDGDTLTPGGGGGHSRVPNDDWDDESYTSETAEMVGMKSGSSSTNIAGGGGGGGAHTAVNVPSKLGTTGGFGTLGEKTATANAAGGGGPAIVPVSGGYQSGNDSAGSGLSGGAVGKLATGKPKIKPLVKGAKKIKVDDDDWKPVNAPLPTVAAAQAAEEVSRPVPSPPRPVVSTAAPEASSGGQSTTNNSGWGAGDDEEFEDW